ncbi:dinuclear metal center protein, YbgI/SA1388 family [Archaeoglobus sulfaticallidus PM70-1]|uniref:Dinuclear metal center protein, YbgI/SA1388 family n=1 Tax=Archaeoglobus sulfaticallidus PM70-1 TaxID=387631 RepID=N0BDI6_9EURY|nr:Nif3-like dinuclear metal center hexameric protein [Archaeoglobus sulfaticallidus]AGK61058.1 dinuclear metal center protein, YbgI/SA1388 family [Archaeoglobus sulfaticallidus PM70-1]
MYYLYEITDFLDEYLQINKFRDLSSNGLQIEGKGSVETVGFTVDACMESFLKAKELGVDLLIVHHGLIWGGLKFLKGIARKRIKFLLENEISLYTAHLPLDAHDEVGNNIQIMKLLSGSSEGFFAEHEGIKIGVFGEIEKMEVSELKKRVDSVLNTTSRVLNFGRNEIEKISIISGSGSFAIEEASQISDCLITGEYRHEAYHVAKELEFNVIFAGHYETETVGLKALMEKLNERFDVRTIFIDVPTNF